MTTILVAEDSATQAVQIRGLLEAADFQVEVVSNGFEALAKLGEFTPDLVLTDLSMPQMNGLDLVVAARREFPQIPVVLMTAFGSEEIAVRALQSGAASYVPKRNLASDLVTTLGDVLEVVRCNREDERLAAHFAGLEAGFALPAVAPPILAVVGYVQDGMARLRLGDATDRVRIGVALDTAVHNMLLYGNLELSPEQVAVAYKQNGSHHSLVDERTRQSPFAARKIHVEIAITSAQVRIVVRHEGPGFDLNQICEAADCEELGGERARGWLLVNSFMDEVRFDPAGTSVTFARKFPP